MALTNRTERIAAHDGGIFDGYTVVPDGGTGPGILLLQEIFGVGAYLKAVAERLGQLGYAAMAPDLFWRIEPGIALDHDEAGLAAGLGYVQRFDMAKALDDCDASLSHLRAMAETGGRAGVVGFCLGGRLAYHVAARSRPDTVVSYYGSGIADALDEADDIHCPILFHFGDEDPYIPADQVEQIRAAFADRAGFRVVVQNGAGHAFDNHEAALFHQPEAAAAAWILTKDFLGETLPATPVVA